MSELALLQQQVTAIAEVRDGSFSSAATAADANSKVLSKSLALRLLQELATNDDFRAAYAANPHVALGQIGVPPDSLPQSNAPLTTLATKETFREALTLVKGEIAMVYTCQVPPHFRINAIAPSVA